MLNSEDSSSLKQKFLSTQSIYHRIEGSEVPPSDDSFQNDVRSAITGFRECVEMVRSLAIFSTNETVEDINSSDLSFLLLDYYLAEMELKVVDTARIDHLKSSLVMVYQVLFESFLERLVLHEIFSMDEIKPAHTAEDTRNQKIMRFKTERALKARAQELTTLLCKTESEEDEELTRELSLTLLKAAAWKAIENIELTNMELTLLKNREETLALQGPDVTSERLDLKKQSAPRFKPFILTKTREDLKKGVFRPGHNLPTMTIDEYLEREYERGNFLQGGTQPAKPATADEDEEALDIETMKARAMDEFKDANPRGWGNRMNKG
ncbi:hypothetical protein HDU67_000532 [Dinochytrium kinnereticum]|nr:hypothetical protein HDU67_000532 [Dinochytrium kinnereticum]